MYLLRKNLQLTLKTDMYVNESHNFKGIKSYSSNDIAGGVPSAANQNVLEPAIKKSYKTILFYSKKTVAEVCKHFLSYFSFLKSELRAIPFFRTKHYNRDSLGTLDTPKNF